MRAEDVRIVVAAIQDAIFVSLGRSAFHRSHEARPDPRTGRTVAEGGSEATSIENATGANDDNLLPGERGDLAAAEVDNLGD